MSQDDQSDTYFMKQAKKAPPWVWVVIIMLGGGSGVAGLGGAWIVLPAKVEKNSEAIQNLQDYLESERARKEKDRELLLRIDERLKAVQEQLNAINRGRVSASIRSEFE